MVEKTINDYVTDLSEVQSRLNAASNMYRMYICNYIPHTHEDINKMEDIIKALVKELKDGVLEVIANFAPELEASKKEYREHRRYNDIFMGMLQFADESHNEIILNHWMKDLINTIENSGAI